MKKEDRSRFAVSGASSLLALSLILTALVGLVAHPLEAAERSKVRPVVQAPEDQALVYFVRPKKFAGGGRTAFVYIDDAFAGALDNNAYIFATLEPGRHMLWTNSKIATGIELLPGETYYYHFDLYRFVKLEESEGKALLEDVKFYSKSTRKETKTARRHLENRSTKAETRFEASHARMPDYPAPIEPASKAGLVTVAPHTPVHLELTQTVTSHLNSIGDEVFYRVTQDVESNGKVWLRKGTLVPGLVYRINRPRSGGRAGSIELAVPAIESSDGTVVPTVGSGEGQGGMRKGKKGGLLATTVVAPVVGIIAAFAVKGDEAYQPAGTELTVLTRDPAWVAPSQGIEVPEAELSADPVKLIPRNSAVLNFDPRRRRNVRDIRFVVDHPNVPRSLVVESIDGVATPERVEPAEIKETKGGWVCTLEGWDVVRFFRLSSETKRHLVEMRGEFEDGSEFAVEVPVYLDLAG